MNELLYYTSSYEYDDTGANPMAATMSPTVATDREAYNIIESANTGTSKTNQEDKNKETGDTNNTKQGIYNPLYILLISHVNFLISLQNS